MQTQLTERQTKILDFIRHSIRMRGYPPTLREIGAEMGIRSTNGVSDHLRALEKKGYLKREDMKSRALVPVDVGMSSLRVVSDEWSDDRPEREIQLDGDGGDDGMVRLDLIGRIAAGPLLQAIEHRERTIHFDRSLLPAKPSESFALRVKGDSMIEAGIHDGDIVFVRRTSEAQRGDIVVALVGDEATLKRYYPEKDHVRLQPENRALSPIFVRRGEYASFRILGVMTGLFRPNSGPRAT